MLDVGMWVVGCGLWSVDEFQNLVPELVCQGGWFRILTIVKKIGFLNFKSSWFPPESVISTFWIWGEDIQNGGAPQMKK
jgi:hypothetical protein